MHAQDVAQVHECAECHSAAPAIFALVDYAGLPPAASLPLVNSPKSAGFGGLRWPVMYWPLRSLRVLQAWLASLEMLWALPQCRLTMHWGLVKSTLQVALPMRDSSLQPPSPQQLNAQN